DAAGLTARRCVCPDAPENPRQSGGFWATPPVRIGKAALHNLLLSWLARLAPGAPGAPGTPGAPGAPGARASLVMGRNLGADSLHSWLEKQGWPVTRLAARSGYRLLVVSHGGYGGTGSTPMRGGSPRGRPPGPAVRVGCAES